MTAAEHETRSGDLVLFQEFCGTVCQRARLPLALVPSYQITPVFLSAADFLEIVNCAVALESARRDPVRVAEWRQCPRHLLGYPITIDGDPRGELARLFEHLPVSDGATIAMPRLDVELIGRGKLVPTSGIHYSLAGSFAVALSRAILENRHCVQSSDAYAEWRRLQDALRIMLTLDDPDREYVTEGLDPHEQVLLATHPVGFDVMASRLAVEMRFYLELGGMSLEKAEDWLRAGGLEVSTCGRACPAMLQYRRLWKAAGLMEDYERALDLLGRLAAARAAILGHASLEPYMRVVKVNHGYDITFK